MTITSPEIFSRRAILTLAWAKYKSDWQYFASLILVTGLCFVVPSYLSEALKGINDLLALLTALAAWVLEIGVGLGLIGTMLKVERGERPPLSELFNYFHLFWPYFLASLLYALIILLGLILFVVPAFVWAVKYGLFAFYIVDQQAKPMAALQLSADATQGYKAQLFVFMIILVLMNLAGALLIGLGLLVTLPVTYLAWIHLYRLLSARLSVPTPVAS